MPAAARLTCLSQEDYRSATMEQTRFEAVRSWAERNESLFRLAEVAIVALFGSIITAYLTWQNYRLAEMQVKVAQAQIEPSLEVSCWNVGLSGNRDLSA